MSIQFAPEPEPTATVLELEEDQTTGPLPLGFEFEFFGVRYTCFDLSSDGFLTFGSDPSARYPDCRPSRFSALSNALNNFITLGWTDVGPLGRRQVAYEVRGAPHRRRLVLSFTRAPASPEVGLRPMSAQLVLHERTGMIDVHTTRQDGVVSKITEEAVRFTTSPW
jgi:hypothetical protein